MWGCLRRSEGIEDFRWTTDQSARRTKGKKLQAMLDEGHVIFPGAAAFIREAAAAVPIAIASGALRHGLGSSRRDLARHFSTIVASGDTPEQAVTGPYQLAFELISRRAGI
jgi:hypothetical protein